MTQKTRIAKLEEKAGIKTRHGYLLVAKDGPPYKIQPYMREYGGTGGEPFELQTWEEVEAFEARPDVDLLIIRVVYADDWREKPQSTVKAGNYSVTVGADLSAI